MPRRAPRNTKFTKAYKPASLGASKQSLITMAAIVPVAKGNTGKVLARLRQAVQTSGRRMLRLINKTVENWEPEHKAKATFRLSLRVSSRNPKSDIGYFMYNYDNVWNLLDRGTAVSYYINITNPAEFSTIPNHLISLPIPVQKYVWTGIAEAGVIPRGWRRMLNPIARSDFEKEIRRAVNDIVAERFS